MTVTKVNGLMMKAEEIDDEGNWEQAPTVIAALKT